MYIWYNILIVIVRYFGGIKLGVGGLINAYKTDAQLVIENAIVVEKTINIQYRILFEYKNLNPDYALAIYYKQFLLQNLALTHFIDLNI